MFDFYFGDEAEIKKNDEDFLIFVKRMLPRWINGIPDSECIAIYRLLKDNSLANTALLETGCGASTIAMVFHSMLNNCKLYSWDTNPSKGSFLRGVINEAICKPLNKNVNDYWEFIAFDSTNKYLGMPILEELVIKPSFGFFDSLHTLDHLISEIDLFSDVAADNFFVALDDAYYTNKSENFSYINMLRSKLSLGLVEQPPENICEPYFVEIEKMLSRKFESIERVDNDFAALMGDDIFFDYFAIDQSSMKKKGMAEKTQDRFVSFQIQK